MDIEEEGSRQHSQQKGQHEQPWKEENRDFFNGQLMVQL